MSVSQGYRAQALQKISGLSATTRKHKSSDIERLYERCPERNGDGKRRSLATAPISTAELDILFALCNAAPLLDCREKAGQLFHQLCPYLLEAHSQVFAPSPFLRSVEPSPWEALTYHLTKAILAIGQNYDELHYAVLDCTMRYLRNCLHAVSESTRSRSPGPSEHLENEGSLQIAAISVSLLGFLEAISGYTDFYNARQMLDLVRLLQLIIDEKLMVSVEGVFSAVRTLETACRDTTDWRAYTKRYAASGRPLGAMILQRSFMRLLVSCSSLQICTAEQLRNSDVFDALTTREQSSSNGFHDASAALVEVMVELAVESMRLLEDGADYLQLGSAWQQHLAFSVKAHSLTTFLNCMVVDEEIADLDVLMSWLEEVMGDPIQMADDTLAAVVLRSMTVVAKIYPSTASSLSRSLPRFIVQGGIRGDTVLVAARSLTYILRQLSQDAVITGLYSLGNVLSASSGTDKIPRSTDLANGNARLSKTAGQNGQMSTQHSTASAISLDMSGEEETSAAYGNIVRAVVSIAVSCYDEKIAALAQSMLLQKLGRISLAVDLHIIKEVAVLALAGGDSEFKSLLMLYDRLSHDGVRSKDITLLTAVRCLQSTLLHIFGN